MYIKKEQFSKLIKSFQFEDLFNELGWDHVSRKEVVAAGEDTFELSAVAEKKGFVVLECSPDSRGNIPSYSLRRKIDNIVTKLHFEHLIIYTNKMLSHQKWQIVIREEGKPVTPIENDYFSHQEPEVLFEKLKGLFFTIDDEESIGLIDVKARISENFEKNAEKVTKKFYIAFKKEHTKFLNFIEGISSNIDKEWYASLMLNRLMFIYFIQKKGFLDNDRDYLVNKLKETRKKYGKDKFYSFYRTFLLTLFHKGLGASKRDSELIELIGNVPYMNGGLFDVHQVENEYNNIQISDTAFKGVFSFFDQYEWHLDTRIEATGKEINPDVIGYIFEKYINDRASMGAYYTKEDITEYISKNCIIPYLFDEIQKSYPNAFVEESEISNILKLSGDRYIHDALKFGIQNDLPNDIAAGIKDISNRSNWNSYAPVELGLPTEIWREVIERRNRYHAIYRKIKTGEISEPNDFILYNLNIRQFLQDIINETGDPKFLETIYNAILNISILDPTCGSGAFLFAALNILEPLYMASIQRLECFVEEHGKGKFKEFENMLALINLPEHPNRRYYIFKSIILNNLFGVDIMKEAIEITKLRLYLKLVSTVDVNLSKVNMGLEPLPDIDFNIRFGNTLVGFASESDLKNTIKHKEPLFADKVLQKFQKQAGTISSAYKDFKNSQLIVDMECKSSRNAKKELNRGLIELNESLNEYQAHLYGLDPARNPEKYEEWKTIFRPFHWYVEFYEIIQEKGGFNVIIGNPPYVEYSKVKKEYTILNYSTANCGNIYAFVQEKALNLLNSFGRCGIIVLIGSMCTSRMKQLQNLYTKKCSDIYLSSYSGHTCPGILFEGAANRYGIWISKLGAKAPQVYTSKYMKWYSSERKFVFEKIFYSKSSPFQNGTSLKLHNDIEHKILKKLNIFEDDLSKFTYGDDKLFLYTTPIHWVKAFTFLPYFKGKGKSVSTQLKKINVSKPLKNCLTAILNSSLFFWWWIVNSDCYHLINREVEQFPVDLNLMKNKYGDELTNIVHMLMNDFDEKSTIGQRNQKTTGLVEFQVIDPKLSKDIIDQIDIILAKYYGFSDEELDYIISYDIKYRMGQNGNYDSEKC